MPWIAENGDRLHVSAFEASCLLMAGLVYECSECRTLHHDEYERWDEIQASLQTVREFVTLTTSRSLPH